MSGYTPSLAEARGHYAASRVLSPLPSYRRAEAEFDRMIEAVRAEARAEEREKADREPSDAEVLEASLTFERVWDEIIDSFDPERDDGITYIQAAMRAALIAAQEARDDF